MSKENFSKLTLSRSGTKQSPETNAKKSQEDAFVKLLKESQDNKKANHLQKNANDPFRHLKELFHKPGPIKRNTDPKSPTKEGSKGSSRFHW